MSVHSSSVNNLSVTVLGPIQSAADTAAAVARSGIETTVIAWLTTDQAAAALVLKDYPVSLHLIEQPADDWVVTTGHFDQAMQQALAASDAVIISPAAFSTLDPLTLPWLADTLGLAITAALDQRDFTSPSIRYLAAVAIDGQALRAQSDGESDLSLARRLSEAGPSEVLVIRQPGASFVYAAETNEGYDTPEFPARGPDRLGLVETFLGAYVARHQLSDSIFESGRYAAMAVSLKTAYPGPLHETAEEIEQRLQEQPLKG